MRQSDSTAKWAASTLNAWDMLSHQDIVEEVGGTFKYFCYVLADFDPIKADEFFENCSMEQVSNAMLAKLNYNRPPDE